MLPMILTNNTRYFPHSTNWTF